MSDDKLYALKVLRQATQCLLLEGKRGIEEYVAANGGTYVHAAEALIAAHQRLQAVDAECERIRAARAAEALRVTAGYTIAELQAMPDQALGRALRVANAVAALIHGPGTIAEVRAAGDAWIAALQEMSP